MCVKVYVGVFCMCAYVCVCEKEEEVWADQVGGWGETGVFSWLEEQAFEDSHHSFILKLTSNTRMSNIRATKNTQHESK